MIDSQINYYKLDALYLSNIIFNVDTVWSIYVLT